MRGFYTVLLALMFLSGCVTRPDPTKLRAGLTKEEVLKVMGKPVKIFPDGDGETWGYRISSRTPSFVITQPSAGDEPGYYPRSRRSLDGYSWQTAETHGNWMGGGGTGSHVVSTTRTTWLFVRIEEGRMTQASNRVIRSAPKPGTRSPSLRVTSVEPTEPTQRDLATFMLKVAYDLADLPTAKLLVIYDDGGPRKLVTPPLDKTEKEIVVNVSFARAGRTGRVRAWIGLVSSDTATGEEKTAAMSTCMLSIPDQVNASETATLRAP